MRAIAVLALVVLAGCGRDVASGADPSPTPEATPASSFEVKDVATDWYLLEIRNQAGTLHVGTIGGGCNKQGHIEVEETDTTVVLRAFNSVIQADACTMELAFFEDDVGLESTLGGRKLVGCRAGREAPAEDAVCRDLNRAREQGFPQTTG